MAIDPALQLLLAGGRPQPNTNQQPADEVFEAFLARGAAHPSTQPMDAQLQQLLNRIDNHPANVPADAQIQDILARFDNHPANVPADAKFEELLAKEASLQIDQLTSRWDSRLANPRNRESTIAALQNTIKFSTDPIERKVAKFYLQQVQTPETSNKPSVPTNATIDPAATAPGATTASQAEVLEGLLYELSTTRSVDDEAAFINRLRDLQHGEGATPEQRAAAFQVRLPDVEVSTTPDGRLSFSGRSAPLNVDSATAERMQRVKAQAEMLNFENPIIIGSNDTVRVLGGRTTAEAASRLEGVRNTLFGASNSPSVQALQSRLDSITSIEDPTERFEALQAMRPAMTAFANERRAEIRNQVFDQYRIHELQQRLAAEEAKDRAHPLYEQFGGADSEITANLRQQLRVAQSDAMSMVEQKLSTDPVLATLSSQRDMVEMIVNRQDQDENRKSFADIYNMSAPTTRDNMDRMGRAVMPNWDTMTPAERTKVISQNPIIEAAGSVTPTQALAFLTKPGVEGKQWLEYVRESEKAGGASPEQLEALMQFYSKTAIEVQAALSATDPNQVPASLRGMVEQVTTARASMTPSDFSKAMELEFIPMAIQIQLNAQQIAAIAEFDRNTKVRREDKTGNPILDEVLLKAYEANMSLDSLTRGGTLVRMKPSSISIKEYTRMLPELAAFVSTRRKEGQINSALISPIDTTQDLIVSMQGSLIANLAGLDPNVIRDTWQLIRSGR